MIGSVCAEEVVAKLLFMGYQRGDYGDFWEVGEGGGVREWCLGFHNRCYTQRVSTSLLEWANPIDWTNSEK